MDAVKDIAEEGLNLKTVHITVTRNGYLVQPEPHTSLKGAWCFETFASLVEFLKTNLKLPEEGL